VLTIALAAFTGSALADNGNGNGADNGNGNGNSQATPAAEPASPAPAPGNSANAPGQMKKSSSSGTTTKGSASQNAGPAAGMKPTNATTHGAKCTTGGSGSSVTCTPSSSNTAGIASGKADVSKRYGNGKTAAQIAVSRGAPAGTELYGPGNSQPHKVAVCPHKTNHGGGVDVHAIKNFTTNCASSRQSSQPVSTTAFQTVVAAQAAQASQPSASSPQPAGGVLGVTATESRPAGGVLGALATAGNVAGETLPFTGFPIWVAVAIALGLIVLGLALRRRGGATI